ncbi:alpha/beta fold hydrolase [Micrococcales bacterium 31B]|nr:alpha/beta fold hydrolase [Micrococcales bacterium 31B]
MTFTHLIAIPGTQCTGEVFTPMLSVVRAAFPDLKVTIHELRESSLDAAAAAVAASAPVPSVLLGHSLGGTVALATARQYPGRVQSVATVCSNPRVPTNRQRAQWLKNLGYVGRGEYLDIIAGLMPSLLHHARRDRASLRNIESECLDMAKRLGSAAYVQQTKIQLTRRDERSAESRCGIPTLSIACEDDPLVEIDAAAEIVHGVNSGRFVALPFGGHMAPLTEPQLVAETLIAWLQQPAGPIVTEAAAAVESSPRDVATIPSLQLSKGRS